MLKFNEYLLSENRVNELAALHPDVPVHQYAAKDPTSTKKFLPWLIAQHKKGKVKMVDDPELTNTLKKLHRNSNDYGVVDHHQHNIDDIMKKINGPNYSANKKTASTNEPKEVSDIDKVKLKINALKDNAIKDDDITTLLSQGKSNLINSAIKNVDVNKIIQHPQFNKDHLDAILKGKHNPETLEAILHSHKALLDPEQISSLLDHDDPNIRNLASQAPNIGEPDIDRIIYNGNPNNISNVLHNANYITPNHLDFMLSNHEDFRDNLEHIINHPKTISDHLTKHLNNTPDDPYKLHSQIKNRLRELNNPTSSVQEEAPTVSVGSGQVAGLGIENPDLSYQAEPGVKKKKKITKFKLFTR
jgi:hypothetical protein